MRRLEALRVFLLETFAGLPRRAWLTIKYRGPRQFVLRAVTFPLRLTPLGRRLVPDRALPGNARARAWYRDNWRPVTIVIPTYGPPEPAIEAVRSIRRTCDPKRVRIVVTDDASPAPHADRLREALAGRAEVLLAGENGGFAVNANRGMRAAPDDHDVVLLNSDVVALPGWLEALQHSAHGA